MKHTISVLVENKFGVLARVAGLFSARGYNIASLAVSETLDPDVSYMTIVVEAKDAAILEQIKKQLNKLIDVITVTDFTRKDHVERELVLVKVGCTPKNKAKLESIVKKFIGTVIQCKNDTAIIEAVGEQAQIKQLLDNLEPFGVKELVRTGKIAVAY
ncbi:MAG TPA: acetolactate synthase small subunit [Candidatus Omnitrophota bacterium]|nr:acetolactate synthase small subunit [Candidatus Omnitrophota bacterium]HQJ15664.1 acetolactate synthase small subunit [Candidatus Omnitrophota bacterium]